MTAIRIIFPALLVLLALVCEARGVETQGAELTLCWSEFETN